MQNQYSEIVDNIIGYTKTDFEKIFKDVILPIYITSCSSPNVETDYKIVDRETEQEVTKW